MRTNNSIKVNKIISILCVILLVVGFVAVFESVKPQKQSTTVFAATEYDSQTEIYEESGIISAQLWNALKKFYNDTRSEGYDLPAIKTNESVPYLTIDLFKNFPVSKLDLSNQNINTIGNLSIFNLSSFDEIDLSNNKIAYLGDELKGLGNLQKIDLSNNNFISFSYADLNQECYSQNLQYLNLSGNKIAECNLSGIVNANIDVRDNYITSEKLTLPTNTNLEVLISHNLIENPDVTNENVKYGFQGVKNNGQHKKNTVVGYYGLDSVEKVKIYFLEIEENQEEGQEQEYTETFVVELLENQTYSLGLGYYKVKFETVDFDDMMVYIAPEAPTIKMFRNGKEIELTHEISSDVEIRIFGEEGANFIYRFNNSDFVGTGDSVEINTYGWMEIEFYQIVDGYVSFKTHWSLEYKKPATKGFVFLLIGVAIFAGMFYIAIKYMPNLITMRVGKKDNKKDNLDI